jgi:hypothetical protein
MVVALSALIVALGGSSYAAVKIGKRDLKRGAVGSRAIADDSIRSKDVRRNALTGQDVLDDSLTNSDIDNGSLQAGSADSATNASNADTLDGIDSPAFTRGACGTVNGAIHGFARINEPTSPTFSTAGVENAYNCSGQSVEARRAAMGFYEVRFNGTPPGIVTATTMQIPSASPSDMNVSLSRTGNGTYVAVTSTLSGTPTDWPFVILLL